MSEKSGNSSNNETKVRVFTPKAIVLGFHGTIAPRNWEDMTIEPYIEQNLKQFLTENWNNTTIYDITDKLRQESFDQHFVYENTDCPVIVDDTEDINEQILSMAEFIIWQIRKQKETKESHKVIRMVWTDGLNKKQIKVPLFKDVEPALKSFKRIPKMEISLFSSVEQNICEKLFANTAEGDIHQYFSHYFDLKTGGSKDIESYKKIANELNVEPKDILYITDYGQSAKCAKQLGFQCLLIIRPQNMKIRDYYLIQFSKITSLLDIEFTQRQ